MAYGNLAKTAVLRPKTTPAQVPLAPAKTPVRRPEKGGKNFGHELLMEAKASVARRRWISTLAQRVDLGRNMLAARKRRVEKPLGT